MSCLCNCCRNIGVDNVQLSIETASGNVKESQRDLNGTFLLFTTFKFGHHTYQIFVNLFVAFLLRERMDEIKNVINMSFFC